MKSLWLLPSFSMRRRRTGSPLWEGKPSSLFCLDTFGVGCLHPI